MACTSEGLPVVSRDTITAIAHELQHGKIVFADVLDSIRWTNCNVAYLIDGLATELSPSLATDTLSCGTFIYEALARQAAKDSLILPHLGVEVVDIISKEHLGFVRGAGYALAHDNPYLHQTLRVREDHLMNIVSSELELKIASLRPILVYGALRWQAQTSMLQGLSSGDSALN